MATRRFTYRGEVAALAMALLVLVAVESVTRVVGADSADRRELRAIPGQIEQIDREDRLVVLLGNSTTREGYDVAVLEEGLVSDGRAATIVTIAPDDTTVADWTAAYTHFVGDRRPDLVVVSFVAGQVADGLPLRLSRVATDFSDWDDLPGHLVDADSVDDALELAAAPASRLYAERTEVADRLLGLLPNYRLVARRNNEVARGSRSDLDIDRCCGYDDLAALLEAIGPSRAVVVALPDRRGTPMDAALPAAVTAGGASFVDARNVPGIGPDRFADELHLDDGGRDLVTRWLAARLAEISG